MYFSFVNFCFYYFTFIFFTMDGTNNVLYEDNVIQLKVGEEEGKEKTTMQMMDDSLGKIVLSMLGKIAIVLPKFVLRVTGGTRVSEDKKLTSEKTLESLAFQASGIASSAALAITKSEVAKLQIFQSLYTSIRNMGEEEHIILDVIRNENNSHEMKTNSLRLLLDKLKEEIDSLYLKIRDNLGEGDDIEQLEMFVNLIDIFMEISQMFGGDETFLVKDYSSLESAENLKRVLE